MASIYSKAYLTISATAAKDSSQGSFAKSGRCDEEICGTTKHGQFFQVCVRKTIQHFDPLWLSREEWPLMHRAWALQERLLSPRVLHFGLQELIWECRHLTTCECSNVVPVSLHRSKIDWATALEEATPDADSFSTWRKLVREYSSRDLTLEEDRLPAISGAARQFYLSRRRTNPGTYLAGLWRHDLFLGLLWHPRYSGPSLSVPTRKPKDFRAPSWSWAAVEGPVDFVMDAMQGVRIQQQVEIISCECVLRTSDPFGSLDGGHLTLQGACICLDLKYIPSGDGNGHVLTLTHPSGKSSTPESRWFRVDFASIEGHLKIGPGMEYPEGRRAYCLRLGGGTLPGENVRTWAMLLVEKDWGDLCVPNALKVYERIGMVVQNYRPGNEAQEDWFDGLPAEEVHIF